jgi:hypothetical protein
MTWSNHKHKIFTIIIYDNRYRGTILDYPFVILSHIAKVSSLVRCDSGIVCLPQPSPVLLWIYLRQDWLYERTDNEKIASKLDTVDWNALLSDSQDVDEMCNTFTETFLRVARECIPTKIVTIPNSDRPWFNSELRREIRKRDRIRKKVKKI